MAKTKLTLKTITDAYKKIKFTPVTACFGEVDIGLSNCSRNEACALTAVTLADDAGYGLILEHLFEMSAVMNPVLSTTHVVEFIKAKFGWEHEEIRQFIWGFDQESSKHLGDDHWADTNSYHYKLGRQAYKAVFNPKFINELQKSLETAEEINTIEEAPTVAQQYVHVRGAE